MRAAYPSWDVPTQPGVHETQPAELDCPVIQAELARSSRLLRKMLRQIGNQVHPDPQPAPAGLEPHSTPMGERVHELGHLTAERLTAIGFVLGVATVLIGWRMGWLS